MEHEDVSQQIGKIHENESFTSEIMDAKRKGSILLDFLEKLDQARAWVCSTIGVSMDITTFNDELPKAAILARVVECFEPEFVKKVFSAPVKEYRHIDNIVTFTEWCKRIKLSRHFLFETVDLYDAKNIPQVIFCLHGLAMYLNKKGMTKGIIVNKQVQFTQEEQKLFEKDIANFKAKAYDTIDNIAYSEEEHNLTASENFKESVTQDSDEVDKDEIDSVIAESIKTAIWMKSSDDIINSKNVSLSSIKKFISSNYVNYGWDQVIAKQHGEILAQYQRNNVKEIEKDALVRTIRLLVENRQSLREIPFESYLKANDFKEFKRAIFRLIHDPVLLFDILSRGYELPLRVLFPDNNLGDFLFSKQLTSNYHRDDNLLIKIAREHFMTSRVFQNIVNVFKTTQNFDLNPSNIQREVYLFKGAENKDKLLLLDDALQDELVRGEIVKRSRMLAEFIETKFKYLLNCGLPYYVRMFITNPKFFETFIEPAIASSKNYVVSELFRYIFARETELNKILDQERIFKNENGVVRTFEIDFTDYSPLKEFLSECRTGQTDYRSQLVSAQRLVVDSAEYFITLASANDLLRIETSIDEINNITLVLKANAALMPTEMAALVNCLELIGSQSPSNFKLKVYSDLSNVSYDAPISVNGNTDKSGSAELVTKVKDIELETLTSSDQSSKTKNKEKFFLDLDNQYSYELDKPSLYVNNILSADLFKKLALLISVSDARDIHSLLKDQTDNEVEKYKQLSDCDLSLSQLKHSVLSEIDSLINKNVISSYKSVLELIASELVINKNDLINKEIALNSDTVDALFKKEQILNRKIAALYTYLSDLSKEMCVNKSGIIFNRQAQPESKFGTYVISLHELKARVYENINLSQLSLMISCDTALVYNVSVLLNKEVLAGPTKVCFDRLLTLKEHKQQCMDICDVCLISIDSLVALINDKYIDY